MTGSMMIVTLLAGPLLVVLVAASACIIIVITSTVAINIMERNHHHAHVFREPSESSARSSRSCRIPMAPKPRTKAKKPSAC